MKVNEKLIVKVGGQQKWDGLPETKRLATEVECLSEAVLEIGAEAYSQLDEREK